MLTLVLAIIVAIVVLIVEFFILSNDDEWVIPVLIVLIGLIISFAPAIGIGDSYNEPILTQEIDLVSIKTSTEAGGCYLHISPTNTYTYRCEIADDYNLGGKNYTIKTITSNVREVESKDCKKAVLKVYSRTPKKSIWFFSGKSIEEYVFYVPEGTVIKDISLD